MAKLLYVAFISSFVKGKTRAWGDCPALRAFLASAEDPGLGPNSHVVTHNHPETPFPGDPMPLSIDLHRHQAHTYCAYIHASKHLNTYICLIKQIFKKKF